MTNFRTIEGSFYDQYKRSLDVMEVLNEALGADLTEVVITGRREDGEMAIWDSNAVQKDR